MMVFIFFPQPWQVRVLVGEGLATAIFQGLTGCFNVRAAAAFAVGHGFAAERA